jgi:cytochrome bd-type quinol oxidase subunit 2
VVQLREHATARVLAVVAAILAAVVLVVYWYLITGQGDQNEQRPRLVAASLILAAFVLLASAVARRDSLRLLLLSLGASTLIVWMVLGALSIGVLLLPAVLVSLRAASDVSVRVPSGSAWAAMTAGAAASVLLALTVLELS